MRYLPVSRLPVLLLLPLLAACELSIPLTDDGEVPEPPTVTVWADGLAAPTGLMMDPLGQLWVVETGAGRVSVMTADGALHPLVTGLPMDVMGDEVTGAWRTLLRPDNRLLIVQGDGSAERSQHILAADVLNFLPGNPPLDAADLEAVADVGAFVLDDQGFAESNPYAATFGPDGDLYIADAAANAILRHDAETGALSLFATFEPLPNPTPVGPPVVDPVPTDVVYADGRFYVSTLTGFPFAEGLARIYAVDMDGTVTVHRSGLSVVTDLAVEPGTGDLLALQFAAFDPAAGFLPNTGRVVRVADDGLEVIVSGLNLASGLHAAAAGELYVSSIADGQVLRVDYATD